jgi:hypothetical protein
MLLCKITPVIRPYQVQFGTYIAIWGARSSKPADSLDTAKLHEIVDVNCVCPSPCIGNASHLDKYNITKLAKPETMKYKPYALKRRSLNPAKLPLKQNCNEPPARRANIPAAPDRSDAVLLRYQSDLGVFAIPC